MLESSQIYPKKSPFVRSRCSRGSVHQRSSNFWNHRTTQRSRSQLIRIFPSQVESLTVAWGWDLKITSSLYLPLHHVHGIVNILLSALWNGGTCEILSQFNAVEVWERLSRRDIKLYMAVPTVYPRLIEAWKRADHTTRTAWASGARACRLTVSGSAALPVTTLELWER
ncbi:MAG: hypothetical protein Ct9H300mP15_05440 [Gemmatimonadota bacterium]|nr:MAG: hypothetical protein Ct9H300mP15_05440 [Gemmatimonadota bacterium]